MKKLLTISTLILLTISTSPLFALTKTAVLQLVAVIPATATFHATDDNFSVVANNNNFTYTVKETTGEKTLFVVAN
jgi:hypothetical protein